MKRIPMSRSTPIFCLVVELLLAPAAFAKTKEQCLANCDGFNKQFEKACKEKGQGGKCEGRGKAMVGDFKKKCEEDCAAREEKKQKKVQQLQEQRKAAQ
jgi:hypothetical protein